MVEAVDVAKKVKARQIIAGWPRGKSSSQPFARSSQSWVSLIEQGLEDKYHSRQTRMVEVTLKSDRRFHRDVAANDLEVGELDLSLIKWAGPPIYFRFTPGQPESFKIIRP